MNGLWIFYHVLVAISIIGVPQWLIRSIPDYRNNWIGYRTKRSLASPQAWKEGNTYAATLLVNFSWALLGIQVISCLLFSLDTALLITIVCWVSALFLVIILTERRLKKQFG